VHTQFFRKFISISPFSCLLTQSFCLTTLFPSVSTPPIQTTSPHISYSRCRNIFILRSSGYFPFTHSSQIFSRLFTKITYNISTELVLKHTCVCVCVVLGGVRDWQWALSARLLYWRFKPHCSYREKMAVSSQCCTLSQTVHRLWMCTAIECEMEEKTHCMYDVREQCFRVTIVIVEKQ